VHELRFRIFNFALHSSVNRQPKTSKVRDDTLGSSNQFSAAEKDEGHVIHWMSSKVRGFGFPFLVERVGYCVNDKDKEDGCWVVALFDSACRAELFESLPNFEVDPNICVQFAFELFD
jgi:hypothetical protein